MVKKPPSKFIALVLLPLFFITPVTAVKGAKESSALKEKSNNQVFLGNYKPEEILISYKEETSAKERSAVKSSYGLKKTLKTVTLGKKEVLLYKLEQGQDVKEVIKEINKNPKVLRAEPNYIRKSSYLPNDIEFSNQWGLHNTGQSIYGTPGLNDADIDAAEAWDIEKGYSNPVTVAVIDSGIDSSHPDLASKVVNGYNWAGISQRYANTAWSFGKQNTYSRAQSIKGTGQSLTNIGLLLAKVGSVSSNIIVSVRESLTGPDLRTLTITPSDVTTDFTEVYKALNLPITLNDNQTYYLVFGTASFNNSNYYLIGGNSDLEDDYYGDVYAEGSQFWWNGSYWENPEDDDYYFDWYFVTNANPDSHDDNGHGTHVSGIIGADSENGQGTTAVSFGSKIMSLKTADSSGGTTSDDLISAIKYAADNGAKVINMSLGGTGSSSLEQDAINYAYNKGVVLVAAAGNEAMNGNPIEYPASYNNVISVGATTNTDTIADFSNFNSFVDVSAPGYGIISTLPTYPVALSDWGYLEDYDYMDGTSMAAPMVAGVSSLVLSRNPSLSPSQVEQIIETNADDRGVSGKDVYFGWGRVNAYRAVSASLLPEEPIVLNVTSSNPNGAYKAGVLINIEVTFSENVNVTGTPKIILETGDVDREAVYISGSGTSTLLFYYTVLEGDNSADLTYRDPLLILESGAEIKDDQLNDADLNLPANSSPASLSSNKDIVIDSVAPDTQITAGPVEGSTTDSDSATFSFTGNDFGGSGNLVFSHRLAGETDWTDWSSNTSANYSNLAVGQHIFEVKTKDAAGNEDATPDSHIFLYEPPLASNPPPSPPGQPQGPRAPVITIQGTNLSLNTSPKSVQSGKAVTIKGQLKATNGQVISGKIVVIKAKVLQVKKKKVKKGKKKIIKTIKKWIWKTIASVTTDSNGNFTLKQKPKDTTIYQAEFSGDSSYKKANSNTTKITVKKAKNKKAKKKKKKK